MIEESKKLVIKQLDRFLKIAPPEIKNNPGVLGTVVFCYLAGMIDFSTLMQHNHMDESSKRPNSEEEWMIFYSIVKMAALQVLEERTAPTTEGEQNPKSYH